MRTALILAITALLTGGGLARAESASQIRLGLWIECEGKFRTLDDAARIRTAVSDASGLGATDLFVQVFRNGKAWFATSRADDGPYRRARAQGYEPLSEVLKLAHERGIRVHAWVNLLRVDDGERSEMVQTLGREAVLTDETGRSLLAAGPWGKKRAAKPDTPGAWLDPTSPVVTDHLVALLGELAKSYPALDGIHLDYTRYPMAIGGGAGGADLGWSRSSRSRFRADLGPASGNGTGQQWNAWRREKLTAFLRRLRKTVKAHSRDLEFSAAVLADPAEAVDRALQDWPTWTAEGILDVVVPMNYRVDDARFDRLARACVLARGKARLLMGIGAWRFGDRVDAIAARVRLSLGAGAQGAVLFSHDNLKSHPGALGRLGALLRDEVLAQGVRPSD